MDIVERRIRFQLYWSVEDGDKADEQATNENSANLDDVQSNKLYSYLHPLYVYASIWQQSLSSL